MAVNVEEVQPYRADWRRGRVASWVTTVDHKRIGILYLWTTLGFFAVGGLLALLIRTQLLTPNEGFMTKNSYNEAVTIHGTTMIFLVLVPVAAAFGNYLVPLMIGARDMAFPRLNALSYWLFVLGGIVLLLSFFARGGAADTGWTAYVPLSTLHSPGHGQDIWILSLHILSLSSAAGAINFIVTIHNMRAPGMSWTRIPLFCWSILTYAWMLIIVLPTISAGLTMMLLDRQAGTNFFNPAKGGSPLLYQHVFWFFGHPEVYIIVLPTMGIVSEIIPVFARKPIFGYKAVAFSTLGIAFFSLLVWAHHMFAVGLPVGLNIFFMLSSMVIAIPTGVKIVNWLATMWRGNISFDTPMLWAIGFISIFTIGGLSGNLPRRRSRSTRPSPIRTSSSPTCTTCCSEAPSSACSAGSTTGGRRCSASASTSGSADGTSGSCSSASTSRSSRSTCSGCWACRGASTRTTTTGCGRRTT